ncbi:MAG: serine/threonine-protein kinase [Myxococcota bacterium]
MELATGMNVEGFGVEATLGTGALATVYRVRHLASDTLHALKVLHLTHPSVQDRLIAGGRLHAQLRHPNVVNVTDVLDVGGSPGLLMAYVHGPTLTRVLSKVRLDLDVVEQLVPGILAGVAAGHRADMVHRDLKPGNILLEVTDQTVKPRIVDFGLATTLGDHRPGLTGSGAQLVTPNYMAPEQIRNARTVDPRNDLFALGAILYELVTGRRAFQNENAFATLSDITGGHWIPVHELRPEVPDRIVEAIEAALELDVEDRVPDCETLWSIWAGPEGPDLETAAAQTVTLSPAWMLRLTDLAPRSPRKKRRRSAPISALPRPGTGELSGATFEVPSRASTTRWMPFAAAGALAALLLLGTGIVVGTRPPAAYVRIEGDAAVRLFGADGAVPSLQAVPPGSYRVEAKYGEDAYVPVGTLTLRDQDEVTVRCEVRLRRCTW